MMRRFIIESIVVSVLAAVVWWLTQDITAPTTVAGAKMLHRLVGYPAPYLVADGSHIYWFSPLFPPMVGLIIASRWTSWRRRIVGLSICTVGFWYIVSLQVAVSYSPYLTLSAIRGYLSQTLISLNSVAVPVVFWLIVTGGPPSHFLVRNRSPLPDAKKNARTANPTNHSDVHALRCVALTALLCALATLPVKLATEQSNANLDAARKRLAGAVLTGDVNTAVAAQLDMTQEQGPNRFLAHLVDELQQAARHASR